MITLITGTPGSGKTLYTVWFAEQQVKLGRRLMVDGIRDLALEHVLVDEAWLRRWYELAEHNDLIVVDEAQRIYPPTTVSQKVGPDVEQLHVHRHKGVDFILITQHPQRISKTVRDLVGRHVHVRRMFGMKKAMLYEWDHCHNVGSLKDAVKSWWTYPRSVFNLYTSAEVHTKQKAVIPKALFVAPVALVIAGVFAWYAFKGVNGGFGIHGGAASKAGGGPAKASAGGGMLSAGAAAGASGAASEKWRVVGRYLLDGDSYVVLADDQGRLRTVEPGGFEGGGVHTAGLLDGARVAEWTGGSSGTGVKK